MASRWTRNEINTYHEIISKGSAAELEAIIGRNGGKIPTPDDYEKSRLRNKDLVLGEQAWSLCCESMDTGKLDVLSAKGMPCGQLYFIAMLGFADDAPQCGRDNLEKARAFIMAALDYGSSFGSWEDGSTNCEADVYDIVRFYPDDIELFDALESRHFGFNKLGEKPFSRLEKRLVGFLLENKHFASIDYLCERIGFEHLRLSIGKTWDKATVDYVASKHLVCDSFDDDCDAAIVDYAMDKGIKPYRDAEKLWRHIIQEGLFDLGGVLLSHGIEMPTAEMVISPKTTAGIDWALEHIESVKYIDPQSDSAILEYAASKGLKPYGRKEFDNKQGGWVYARGVDQGMRVVCDSLDLDAIEAFLEAGVLEGADASRAVEEGRQDIVDLFEKYGISTAQTIVADGRRFLDGDTGEVVVPDTVKEIAPKAFAEIEMKSLSLPDGLEKIGAGAFCWTGLKSITIPKTVREIGEGACAGISEITIYDSIDPNAKPARDCIDDCNGRPNSNVGWLGVKLPDKIESISNCAADAMRSNCEITVRSADTDEVKYKVWMPVGSADRREVYCTLASAWGRNADFAFERLDALFDELRRKDSKIRTAMNRLRYPIDLSDEARGMYAKYIARMGKDVVSLFIKDDDVESLKFFEAFGIITKTNVETLIAKSEENGTAPLIHDYLVLYKNERFAGKATSALK